MIFAAPALFHSLTYIFKEKKVGTCKNVSQNPLERQRKL